MLPYKYKIAWAQRKLKPTKEQSDRKNYQSQQQWDALLLSIQHEAYVPYDQILFDQVSE